MRARIIITFTLLTALFSASHAEVMECYSFNPVAGKQTVMIERMSEVAKIQERFGAHVDIYAIEIGGSGTQFDYCMRWDTPQDWGTSMMRWPHHQTCRPGFLRSKRRRARDYPA